MGVPFIDLKPQHEPLLPQLEEALSRVLRSGVYILGPEGAALEQEIAAICGAAHAAGVANGTDALVLSLRALGIGPGDEVIVPAFTFFATAEAVALAGAIPVFCDIDPDTYAIDPAHFETQISSKTKAVIPVHLYGHPAPMEEIMAIARRHQIFVVEDCAQAVGAKIGGKPVGSFGDLAALSFYPTKNLGGAGDGGMVLANDRGRIETVRKLRAHGSEQRYTHELIGTNSRLDEMQAAILRVKLSRLDAWTEDRRALAARYNRLLAGLPHDLLAPPAEAAGARHVYHLYTVRTPKRASVVESLSAAGIGYQIAYPSTLPDQPAMRRYPHRSPACPQARKAAGEVLALPLYPGLSEANAASAAAAVRAGLSRPV